MLDPLRRADQRKVGRRVFLFLAFGHDFLAFLDKSHHALAGFRAGCLAEQVEAFVETLDLIFGLGQMLFEQLPQLIEARRLRHLRQRLDQLLFRMQDVAQFIDQQFVQPGLVDRRRAFRDDGAGGAWFGLKGRGFREYPAVALVPGTAGVDLAMVAGAGGIIEELVDQSRRRRDAADAEGGLAHALERQRRTPSCG